MAINRYPLLIIVLCSLLLVWARFDEFAVGSMADDAVYAELARSISEGRGPVLHVTSARTKNRSLPPPSPAATHC